MNYYNQTAAGYSELHREEQLKKLKLIKDIIKVKPGETILDLGCGSGFLNEFFPNNKITSVDPSEELLKQNKNPDKFQAGAEQLPLPDHVFDWVICVTAIHHFDLEKAIKEIKRVGKKNFVITILKKSPKREEIITQIKNNFKIKKQIDEEKDLIYFLEA